MVNYALIWDFMVKQHYTCSKADVCNTQDLHFLQQLSKQDKFSSRHKIDLQIEGMHVTSADVEAAGHYGTEWKKLFECHCINLEFVSSVIDCTNKYV